LCSRSPWFQPGGSISADLNLDLDPHRLIRITRGRIGIRLDARMPRLQSAKADFAPLLPRIHSPVPARDARRR
jgi:hypothetical protein